jgi:tetratricopeptide (TPR) repeat protein
MRHVAAFTLLLAGVLVGPAHAAIREQAKVEGAYRKVLAAWAGGDEEGALAQLLRLDETAVAGSRAGARLERAKLAVGRAVARRHPSALLAAVTLEQRAYVDYASRRPALAGEARRTAAALVQAHAALDRSAAALDAALLTSLAGELATRAQQGAAADLYGRALAISPGQPAALLGLAAIHELHGRYALAADLLAPLVAKHPHAREARLRLALNELRLGRRDNAERELRRLAGEGVDWVRSLAAQELARLLLARGDVAGAGAVLDAAAAVLPCDPSLPVQAALVAERAGAARALDLSTQGACGEAAESARARYTHPPTSELLPLREHLAAAEPGWRRALGDALGVAAAVGARGGR